MYSYIIKENDQILTKVHAALFIPNIGHTISFKAFFERDQTYYFVTQVIHPLPELNEEDEVYADVNDLPIVVVQKKDRNEIL